MKYISFILLIFLFGCSIQKNEEMWFSSNGKVATDNEMLQCFKKCSFDNVLFKRLANADINGDFNEAYAQLLDAVQCIEHSGYEKRVPK
ncbi:hypothetical protein EIJ81_01435 (plasmid) [Aliivibrio salmonicida]|uniref:Exported protein n=1 Tax=Aliivibrio salmonicida (strain LFI1238) TaxID=316275 RepID=B6ET65_ALISL|nr:hypothetical protein [Aliivibrio salmonicida]AZL83553.1 hypothetical protein EIJ81_01435 [Aliivibrio salmonicida]CAQ81954.1 putative exported protein [Aliivibrio salmonicida LFI1238]